MADEFDKRQVVVRQAAAGPGAHCLPSIPHVNPASARPSVTHNALPQLFLSPHPGINQPDCIPNTSVK